MFHLESKFSRLYKLDGGSFIKSLRTSTRISRVLMKNTPTSLMSMMQMAIREKNTDTETTGRGLVKMIRSLRTNPVTMVQMVQMAQMVQIVQIVAAILGLSYAESCY